MNRLYPLFLKLEGRTCLVVGGGTIAAGKVQGLRDAGALVKVVSPSLVEELAELHRAGLINWHARQFSPADLDGTILVIVATDNEAVSAAVFHEAEARDILCNAVDQDDYCSVHVPAIARAGDIAVAVSTAGKSPAFGARLKAEILELLHARDIIFVRELGRLRPRVLNRFATAPSRRMEIFRSLVRSYIGTRDDTSSDTRDTEFPAAGHLELSKRFTPAQQGTVSLVGAGPGDMGLLTLRGATLLQTAEVVFYDRLVGPDVIDWIPDSTEKIYVGKEAGACQPANTGQLLVEAARKHRAVVRLKGGDPSVFGRGGDEMLACLRADIPVEIIPGVSALNAVPAAAGIPITFRGFSHQVVIRSGYRQPGDPAPELTPPPPEESTFIYFMTVGRLTEIVTELRERDGLSAETPIAIIQRGTLPDQHVLHGTLGTIIDQAARAALKPPAMIVVGQVVRFLHGRRSVTELVRLLEEHQWQ